jgi:hypothetical protein
MAIPFKSLLLTWNDSSSGVEFKEHAIQVPAGALLVGKGNDPPDPLSMGTVNQILKVVNKGTEADPDLEVDWADQEAGHTQNTDTGTTSATFQLDSENSGLMWKSHAGAMVARNQLDTLMADIAGRRMTAEDGFIVSLSPGAGGRLFAKQISVEGATDANHLVADDGAGTPALIRFKAKRLYAEETTPLDDNELITKSYADNLIAANDAMIFGGVVADQTALEAAAGDDYNKGLTFKAGTSDVTIVGKVVEAGDMIIAHADASGTFSDADWSVIQTDITNPVERNGLFTENQLIVGHNGTTVKKLDGGANANGKILKMVSDIPTWATETGFDNPMESQGQLIKGGSGGNPTAFDMGTGGKLLAVNGGGTDLEWVDQYSHPTGFSNVPASVLDEAAVISQITVNDEGHVTGVSTRNLTPLSIGAMKDWEDVPATPTATGAAKDMAIDLTNGFLYLCIASGDWRRIPISKWTT